MSELDKLLCFQAALIVVTLVAYPLAAWLIRGRNPSTERRRRDRSLFLPNGSIRVLVHAKDAAGNWLAISGVRVILRS